MRFRGTVIALATLALIQVAGVPLLIAGPAAAQSEQLVVVLTAEKSLEACEVQYYKQYSEDIPRFISDGPPEPCQGGLVTAYVTTQAEANTQAANVKATGASEDVRILPLTGEIPADEAAITAQMGHE